MARGHRCFFLGIPGFHWDGPGRSSWALRFRRGSPARSRFDPPELQAPVMCERRALLGELTSHLGGIRWNLSSLQLSKRDGSENWVPHGTVYPNTYYRWLMLVNTQK